MGEKNEKNIVLICVITLNFIIIGTMIYQNNYINRKIQEIDRKLETLSFSNNQQDIQINQLTEKQRKSEQQKSLKNSDEKTDESIFENTSTIGLTPITKDEAKNNWEKYLTNTLSENIADYNTSEIKKVMVKPNNYFTAGIAPIKTADFEREAYFFKYTKKDNLSEVCGYIDIYTGKIIGGYYNGD